MMRVDMMQLESDYQQARTLMDNHKYVQAVVNLEKLLRQTYDENSKEVFKNLYKDIIFAYRAINNKTRADYYLTKAIGTFGEIEEFVPKETHKIEEIKEKIEETIVVQNVDLFEEEIKESFVEEVIEEIVATEQLEEKAIVEEVRVEKIEQVEVKEFEKEQGDKIVLRTVNDFEMLKKPFKIKANDTNEISFNNIFVEIFTAVESKKYFGYFKLNLNKLNDCLSKGLESLEKENAIRLKWEVAVLLDLIEKNGITSFDTLYRLEFEELFGGDVVEEKKEEVYEPNTLSFDSNGTFSFREEEKRELSFETDNHEEIKRGIDKIVEKNRDVFEDHNTLLNLDAEYTSTGNEVYEEVIALEETVLDLNMENSSTNVKQNETIIVEINTQKVRENNLEVSKVKDVVLEVLENLRKADLDIFSELKVQSEDRAQKVGTEKEKKGLLSGLEGMLEIKFGVVSLDIVPEMEKISELERLYEVKEKILATRDFTEIEKIVEASKS